MPLPSPTYKLISTNSKEIGLVLEDPDQRLFSQFPENSPTSKEWAKDWSGTVLVKQPLFLKDWLTALQSALVETVLSKNDIKLPNEYCQIEQGLNLKEQNLNIDFD